MNFGFETQFTQKAFLNAGLNNERIKKSNLYCLEFLCFTSIFSFFIGFSPIRNNVSFQWFRQRCKKPMLEALEKIKAELMVLGLISLLLTFGATLHCQHLYSHKARRHNVAMPHETSSPAPWTRA